MLFATLLYAFIWYSQTSTKRLSVNRPTSVPRPVSRVTVHKIVSQSLPTNKYLKLPLVLCLRRSGHLTAVRHSCSNASQNNLCNPAWWLCFRGIFLLFFFIWQLTMTQLSTQHRSLGRSSITLNFPRAAFPFCLSTRSGFWERKLPDKYAAYACIKRFVYTESEGITCN